jgi:hypothetical protein
VPLVPIVDAVEPHLPGDEALTSLGPNASACSPT